MGSEALSVFFNVSRLMLISQFYGTLSRLSLLCIGFAIYLTSIFSLSLVSRLIFNVFSIEIITPVERSTL